MTKQYKLSFITFIRAVEEVTLKTRHLGKRFVCTVVFQVSLRGKAEEEAVFTALFQH